MKRLFILVLFAGLAVILPACASSQIPTSVPWGSIPKLPNATHETPTVAGGEGATGIKATDDGKYLYLEIAGCKPPVHRSMSNQAENQGEQEQNISEDWIVTLDSDALMKPRKIVFSAGKHETKCSDSAVKFEETGSKLRLAVPKTAVAASPVHIRVERILSLYSNGRLISYKRFAFPANGPAIYDTPGLPVDPRVPQVSRLKIKDVECTSAVLQWETNKRLSARIRIASEGQPFKPVSSKELAQARQQHKVRLNELEPDTLYRFSISGRDLTGNVAAPVSGTFRTATADKANGLQQARAWREVPLLPPAGSSPDDRNGYTSGVTITREPTVWPVGRELAAGHYRLLVYSWNAPNTAPIHLYLARSAEVPVQKRHIAVINPLSDGKLHQHEIIFSTDTPFDEIMVKTANGHAGPVTSFKLYEIPAPLAGASYFGVGEN